MIAKILSELVKFKTLTQDIGENRRALAWIQKQLRGLPLYFSKVTINGHPALIITTRKTKQPKLLLQAHIDVVGGSPSVFVPKLKGKKLFGRGVFDMKYAAACYVALLKDLAPELKFYDLGVMLTSDEETGGRDGVGALLKMGYGAKLCFLPDGGEDWKMQRSAKGIYQARVISRGTPGHSSRPWSGQNAIENLINFLNKLKKEFRSEPCGQKFHNHNTINVSRISGGKTINQIPDYAEADLDIRFVPDFSLQKIRQMIKKNLAKSSGLKLTEFNSAEAYRIDFHDQHLKLFLFLLKKFGHTLEFVDSHGSSDARYFVNKKIPTIILRPVGGGHHTDNEWIDIAELDKFYHLLRQFVIETART